MAAEIIAKLRMAGFYLESEIQVSLIRPRVPRLKIIPFIGELCQLIEERHSAT